MTAGRWGRGFTATVAICCAGLLAACAAQEDTADAPSPAGTATGAAPLRLYTTVTQDTVDAVIEAWDRPGSEVEVFRAPTAEFNARVAAERREGGARADVFWLTDPPSMLQYDADGLLESWTPGGADALPETMRQDTWWGTRVLNLVIAHQPDHDPAPAGWRDLTDPALAGEVAVFDPSFAGSGLGALGYFLLDDDFGEDHLRALADNGAVQVQSPTEVVTGVAEGRFAAGWTLDKLVRDAIDDGSPVELVWPEPGAIAVTSPIAVLTSAAAPELAREFVEHVLSVSGQEAIAGTGWQPARGDVDWPHQAEPALTPDWTVTFERREELLEQYRAVFGG